MSDNARQGLGEKVGAAMKPDSQKTTGEQFGDHVKGTADNAASALQPQGQKSTTQKMGDAAGTNSSNDSMLDKAKNALGMGGNTTTHN